MKFEPGRVDAIVKQFLRKLQIMREDQETYPRWIVPVLVVLLFLMPQLLMMLLIALVIYVAVQLASEKNGVYSPGKTDAYRWQRVQETRTEERTTVQAPLRQVREEEPQEEDDGWDLLHEEPEEEPEEDSWDLLHEEPEEEPEDDSWDLLHEEPEEGENWSLFPQEPEEEPESVRPEPAAPRRTETEEEDGDSGKVWDMSLDRKEQLKQLEVLREAGIIEGKEYRERKRRIERGR